MNVLSTNMKTGSELELRPGKGMTREEELLDCMRMCWNMIKSLSEELEWSRRLHEMGIYEPWEAGDE